MADKKVLKFTTLSNTNPQALSANFNYLLKQGWTLAGGMQSTGENSGSLIGSSSVTYSQAMVLYEGDQVTLSTKEEAEIKQELEKYNAGCLPIIIIGIIIAWLS